MALNKLILYTLLSSFLFQFVCCDDKSENNETYENVDSTIFDTLSIGISAVHDIIDTLSIGKSAVHDIIDTLSNTEKFVFSQGVNEDTYKAFHNSEKNLDDYSYLVKDSFTSKKEYEKILVNLIDSLYQEKKIRKNKKSIKYIEEEIFYLNEKLYHALYKNFETLPTEKQWFILIRVDGCLSGGQYVVNGKFGNNRCIMTSNKHPGSEKWKFFLKKEKDILVPFFIEKISETSGTTIHTCPYYSAKQGELAVYCLQYLFKINWFKISEEYDYYIKKHMESEGFENSYQDFLWQITEDSVETEKMKKNWMKIYKL